ncbi:MAG: site-specific DNA-methyltransferase [Patescibacteria group bacterium]
MENIKNKQNNLNIVYVDIDTLIPALYNPRKASMKQEEDLKKSLTNFDLVEPIIVNSAKERENIIIGGHFRWRVAKKMGYTKIPVVYVNIPDIEKEKELNLRLNKNTGEWDLDLLKSFEEMNLLYIGFSSEELDQIFEMEDIPENFDLEKELRKLNIDQIEIKKGDVFELNGSRLMCGDSTIEKDIYKLMGEHKANMCFTDPPYILDYLHGKTKNGSAVEGFGAKRDRRYLETETLPDDFTELWMSNISKIQKEDFSIIVYENWKNLRTIWNEMEKYWKIKNMLVWHLPNRHQGFSAKYKFFSKHDIAMLGATDNKTLNLESEIQDLQNEYETALYAITGKPHWEGYEKGKKIQPTDFIEFIASDEKHSGQGIIFGTKPLEIIIPYIKVLTKRDDLIVEPFGGSGSTLIASIKMKRRCFVMEKSPVYAEVIRKRWENLVGKKAIKL